MNLTESTMRRRLMLNILLTCFLIANGTGLLAQQPDIEAEALRVKHLYETALKDDMSYTWLEQMVNQCGHRLSGSEGAAKAVKFTERILDSLGLDSVWLQQCVVPRWIRGEKEIVRIQNSSIGNIRLRALALGHSVKTPRDGIEANVIEILNLDSLREMPDRLIKGKIVFFNRPLDETLLNTFQAYGRAVDQRWAGPKLAAQKGAVGVLVRSMTTAVDTVPHTGSTDYDPTGPNVPALAISTVDANLLSSLLKKEPVRAFIKTNCFMADSVISYNVIGQINGSEKPDEIILVGGHLDSWDVGHGAHDDGTGCMQSIEVMHLLKKTNYVPRRTIRCVLFMNEENGLMGAKEYGKISNALNEFHLAAIEADGGGALPLGFGCTVEGGLQERYLKELNKWWSILEAYGLDLNTGGGGADINQLKSQGGMLFALRVNSQRYFDYHHTAEDKIDKVHPRELKLGAAAMAALVTLIDSHTERLYE